MTDEQNKAEKDGMPGAIGWVRFFDELSITTDRLEARVAFKDAKIAELEAEVKRLKAEIAQILQLPPRTASTEGSITMDAEDDS